MNVYHIDRKILRTGNKIRKCCCSEVGTICAGCNGTAPLTLPVRIGGFNNGSCSSCDFFNGIFILNFDGEQVGGECQYVLSGTSDCGDWSIDVAFGGHFGFGSVAAGLIIDGVPHSWSLLTSEGFTGDDLCNKYWSLNPRNFLSFGCNPFDENGNYVGTFEINPQILPLHPFDSSFTYAFDRVA